MRDKSTMHVDMSHHVQQNDKSSRCCCCCLGSSHDMNAICCQLAAMTMTYLLTGGRRHSSGSASVVASSSGCCRHKHGLHAFLQSALLSVDNVAHQDVHQGVFHQRHEYEDGTAGHEHVNSLYTVIRIGQNIIGNHIM